MYENKEYPKPRIFDYLSFDTLFQDVLNKPFIIAVLDAPMTDDQTYASWGFDGREL